MQCSGDVVVLLRGIALAAFADVQHAILYAVLSTTLAFSILPKPTEGQVPILQTTGYVSPVNSPLTPAPVCVHLFVEEVCGMTGPDLSVMLQMDSKSRLKLEDDHRFLQKVVYADLQNLNTGFDSALIYHFSPADFTKVIERCERLHIRVIGMEVFSGNVDLLEIEISPEEGFEWTRRLIQRYEGTPNITISATFDVPDTPLKSN